MDQVKKECISNSISYCCFKILDEEMKIPVFESPEEIEDYFIEIAEILCAPLIHLLGQGISMLKGKNIPPNVNSKVALLISEKVKSICYDCLNKNGIEHIESRMERLAGHSVAEIIESMLAMEEMGREYRLKIPFFVPIPDFESRLQVCFPSKEKPIHIILIRENGEGRDEYYLEEVENPKFRWVKRNSEEEIILNEFIVNDIN